MRVHGPNGASDSKRSRINGDGEAQSTPQTRHEPWRSMFTQRAIRRLKPDPVSDEDIRTLMDAAGPRRPTPATSTGAASWLVRDREKIRKFAEALCRGMVGQAARGLEPRECSPR